VSHIAYNIGEAVLEIGRTIPGWSILLLLLIVITLMIGGRALDLMEMTASSIEEKMGEIPTSPTGSETLKQLMPEYGYKTLARTTWATITALTTTLLTLFVVAKIASAFIKKGEEV